MMTAMSDNTNILFPKVETFGGQDGGAPKTELTQKDVNKPKKRGALAKGRAKKKPPLLSRDHFKSASEVESVSREKMKTKKLQVGQLPQVAIQATALQNQSECGQDELTMAGVTLPDILMKHSNLWGKRQKTKRHEKIHLEVAGMDLQLPPPKPMSMSRKKQLASTKLTYGSEHAMLKEVEDIKQILHCHIVGMPIEMNKTTVDDKEVARPIFHCNACYEFWKNTGEIRVGCSKNYKPVKGPVILLSSGAAALIKSVWTKRGNTQEPQRNYAQNDTQQQVKENLTTQESSDEAIDILNELSDNDDCSVVLEHIAEGIVRNAGFEEHVLRIATREVAENLALIISGRKPDDIAMMELIEKYLGETDLMILRGMIEGANTNDMKILKERSGFDMTEVWPHQREKASKLLDRLDVLKSRESNGFRSEKVMYLTELFSIRASKDKRSGDSYIDKRGNFKDDKYVDKETETNMQLRGDASADDFMYNFRERSDIKLVDQKRGRAAGGKYGKQKILKNIHLHSKKQDVYECMEPENVELFKNTVKVEHVHGHQIEHKQCIGETGMADFKENINIKKKYILHEKHSRKGFFKNKDGSKGSSHAKKSSHKVIKTKAHIKPKKNEMKSDLKPKSRDHTEQLQNDVHSIPNSRVNTWSTVEHIVYDIDDEEDDDYDNEENDLDVQTFLIPGSDGYSDSTYNYLVEEFVAHYEQMSVNDNGEPMSFNVGNLRKEMQHGVVKKTGLSRKPVVRSESEEAIVNMFRAGSTVNINQLFVSEDRNNNKSDVISIIDSSTSMYGEETKVKQHHKKVKSDKPKRAVKNKILVETTDSDYTDSDGSELYENDRNSMTPPLVNSKHPSTNHISKNKTGSKAHRKKSLLSPSVENNILSQKSPTQFEDSSTKHISVAETHFGMQLDALANLPTAPNAADLQVKRKKSLGPTTRTKIVSSLPKEAIRAYHSKQIENAAFAGSSQVKDAIEEIIESKTKVSEPATEATKREIKKKLPITLGMSRKSDSKRRMSRSEAVLHSVTSILSRPASSKVPLPPIHKTSQDILTRDTQSPDLYEQEPEVCPTMMEKPIAWVKPRTMTKMEIKDSAIDYAKTKDVESIEVAPVASPSEDIIERTIHDRPRIYIPQGELSILSFTPSFSFSLFSLPNQYKKQNDDVKNSVYKVGRTQPKEATQELLAKIPTRDKTKGTKVQSKTNKIVSGLNKRVLRKVADPKPIARYVKKLEVLKEHPDVDTSGSGSKIRSQHQASISDTRQRSSHIGAEIQINVEVETNSNIDVGSDEDIVTMKDYLEDQFNNKHVAYASVLIESQMHLANTESVLIKVQEYV